MSGIVAVLRPGGAATPLRWPVRHERLTRRLALPIIAGRIRWRITLVTCLRSLVAERL
jgi:hypothetical protein